MKCANCGTELPEDSSFCLRCGNEVAGGRQASESDDSDFSISSMMLFAIAFILFFFSLVPMFLDSWEGMLLMDAIGVVVIIVAFLNLWASRKHEERVAEQRERAAERMLKAKEASMVKIKCRYCGALNERTALKCESCGATL